MAKKDELEDKEMKLTALEDDILSRMAEVEKRELALQDKEVNLEAQKSAIEDRKNDIETRLNEVAEREAAAMAGKSEESLKDLVPITPARKRLRYKCVKKCHHPVSPTKPATCKLYYPGEDYYAFEGDEVPKHFQLIRDAVDELEASKLIEEENQRTLPPFLADKVAAVHGGS